MSEEALPWAGEEPPAASADAYEEEEANLLSMDNLWKLAGVLLLAILLFYIYKAAESWAQRREEAAAEERRERLREARARHAASLEAEMEAFKESPAYAELQKASAAATGEIRPEHRGQISRHGITPANAPKPWRPSPAERYGRTRRGGGGG